MNITHIRSIGTRMRQEILSHLDELRREAPLGMGAAGDITHAIDRKAEDVVIKELEKLKEPITLVSEECGFRNFFGGGPMLLIDPIDGSRNAVSGVPLFSTSIALVRGKKIRSTLTGYVLNIISGDEYWAIRGQGAFINGVRMRTQQGKDLKVVAYEAQTPRVDIPRIAPLISMYGRARCFGSTALDLAHLSQGAFSSVIIPFASRSFDFAAGCLLVSEAGGIVTDISGQEIGDVQIGLEKVTTLLGSANKHVHEEALNILM